jgi:hypothetical protein
VYRRVLGTDHVMPRESDVCVGMVGRVVDWGERSCMVAMRVNNLGLVGNPSRCSAKAAACTDTNGDFLRVGELWKKLLDNRRG